MDENKEGNCEGGHCGSHHGCCTNTAHSCGEMHRMCFQRICWPKILAVVIVLVATFMCGVHFGMENGGYGHHFRGGAYYGGMMNDATWGGYGNGQGNIMFRMMGDPQTPQGF